MSKKTMNRLTEVQVRKAKPLKDPIKFQTEVGFMCWCITTD